ncbi:MAG TPA: hypothetical protein VNK24_00490 [Elusimicrobiota bacterium]|nr:hypothetical protein [Elusimicrobiota bacterium]
MKGIRLGAAVVAFVLTCAVAWPQSQSQGTIQDKGGKAQTTLQEAGACGDLSPLDTGGPCRNSVPAVVDVPNKAAQSGDAKSQGEINQRAQSYDLHEAVGQGGSSDNLSVPAPHEEVGVAAPKTGGGDKRANRNGVLTGAYAGYVAMSVFGFGFLGLLFAAGGGYLFGNHVWKMEHPSS